MFQRNESLQVDPQNHAVLQMCAARAGESLDEYVED